MKISCTRIGTHLASQGFIPRGLHDPTSNCAFVRPDQVADLYQQIDVKFAGRESEAVFAYVSVSVTKWIRFKGLTESRLLYAIASDKERGWAVIKHTSEATAWEE